MKSSDFASGGAYQVGRVVGAISASYEACATEPPSRYSQASLMDDMMSAYKFAQTDQDRATLRQIDGLGTARTRESTITALVTRGFLEMRKPKRGRLQHLVPTQMAREIVRHLPLMLTDVGTTAKWELVFRMVEQGKATPEQAAQYLGVTLARIVQDAKSKAGQIKLPVQAAQPAATQYGRAASAARR